MEESVTEKTYDIVESDGTVVEFAEPPKMPSPAEMRKLRKQFVTVQHPKVASCGHRLDMTKQPSHTNCEACWFSWFSGHKEIVDQCHEMFQADGGVLMTQLQGRKFTKRFTQFMATLAQWEKQQNLTEINE